MSAEPPAAAVTTTAVSSKPPSFDGGDGNWYGPVSPVGIAAAASSVSSTATALARAASVPGGRCVATMTNTSPRRNAVPICPDSST